MSVLVSAGRRVLPRGWADFGRQLAIWFCFLGAYQLALGIAASWTYWNSEFTVVGLALLWVYLRRNDAFVKFRNTILLANVIGLVGYVLLPTAPPRMFPDFGFDDTLSSFGELNHGSGLIHFV